MSTPTVDLLHTHTYDLHTHTYEHARTNIRLHTVDTTDRNWRETRCHGQARCMSPSLISFTRCRQKGGRGTYALGGENFVVAAEVRRAPATGGPALARGGLVAVQVLAIVGIAGHTGTTLVAADGETAQHRTRGGSGWEESVTDEWAESVTDSLLEPAADSAERQGSILDGKMLARPAPPRAAAHSRCDRSLSTRTRAAAGCRLCPHVGRPRTRGRTWSAAD